MAALPARARDRLPGLKTDRADIMLAGAVTVDAVMERVGADRLEVCAQGLREGVFYERFLAPRDPPLLDDVRRAGVLNVARLYRYDAPHADRVARLALALYEELARLGLHPADEAEREWLWAAGMLHDVGVMVDYNDHHKHSYYLVLNAGLPGFAHRELAMIALLVRAHRKGPVSLEGLGPVLEAGDERPARAARRLPAHRRAPGARARRPGALRDLRPGRRRGARRRRRATTTPGWRCGRPPSRPPSSSAPTGGGWSSPPVRRRPDGRAQPPASLTR